VDQSPSGAAPQWSEDGQWWWDGQQWLPASKARAERDPQVSPDTPTATEGRLLSDFMGIKITLFRNRIEFDTKVLFSIKKEAITLRNIADVSTVLARSMVYVKTNDGKKHTLVTNHPKEVREAILAAL
jgi:hypothetical protein